MGWFSACCREAGAAQSGTSPISRRFRTVLASRPCPHSCTAFAYGYERLCCPLSGRPAGTAHGPYDIRVDDKSYLYVHDGKALPAEQYL